MSDQRPTISTTKQHSIKPRKVGHELSVNKQVVISIEPVLIDRPTARQLLANISDRKLDELIRAGRITPRKIDGRVVFTIEEIRRFAAETPSWEPK